MRRDVHNIVSERPKSNRTWTKKALRRKQVLLDSDGEQFDESANHALRPKQKYRATRFNILKRFLVNRVGRPWDKVWAEACEQADARSFQGAEVREFLKSFVAKDCWLEGRTVMSHDVRGCPIIVRGLYVDPKSGLLCHTSKG